MMNMYKMFIPFLLVSLLVVASANAAEVSQTELEGKVMAISVKLRCAVCQNQPVSESNSGLARDMRTSIREQLQAGKTETEVVDFFVARYGDYILIEPRTTGAGLPLWLLPPVLLLLISFLVFMTFKGARNKPLTPAPELDEEARQRVRQARETASEREKG